MATKCTLLVVAALSLSALAANDSPASLVAAKEVAEAFGEALKEEQPLLKDAELHKSAVMASKDDLVAALANPGFQRPPSPFTQASWKAMCTHVCNAIECTWCLRPFVLLPLHSWLPNWTRI